MCILWYFKKIMTKNKDTKKQSISRPPVVAVLGHVDHGKTTLLDYLRSTHTAEKEAGGITQSIGAYEINKDNKKITFIDTPGHEAFTKMRQRGADIADIAIMVVAADDGVKPQTKEIIDILKELDVPYLVVINKIDKNNANVEKTKQDLIAHNVMLEGFGGDVPYSLISAKTGEGVNDMIDMIILLSEMQGLEWNPSNHARGFILESHMDRQRGVTASVIIKDGILHKGDNIYTQSSCGNIKILENFMGKAVEKIEPSSPARIVGFNSMLNIGEIFSSEKLENDDTNNDADKEDKCKENEIKNNIEIYFGDSGKGLINTLKEEYEKQKDIRILSKSGYLNILKWSFNKWSTSKGNEEIRGTKGLYRINRIVNKYNGLVLIRNNDVYGGYQKGG